MKAGAHGKQTPESSTIHRAFGDLCKAWPMPSSFVFAFYVCKRLCLYRFGMTAGLGSIGPWVLCHSRQARAVDPWVPSGSLGACVSGHSLSVRGLEHLGPGVQAPMPGPRPLGLWAFRTWVQRVVGSLRLRVLESLCHRALGFSGSLGPCDPCKKAPPPPVVASVGKGLFSDIVLAARRSQAFLWTCVFSSVPL